MREIKFRAWDKKREGYHYGVEMYCSFQPVFDDGEELCFSEFLLDKERFTLEQYTGLKDKNDKEIYEGDIVRRREATYKVVFMPGSFSFEGNGTRCNRHYYPADFEISECWEVIGNIHENPNLLKEREINLIEELKKNERAWKFLTDEERACMIAVGSENCWYLSSEGFWLSFRSFYAGYVYRIKDTYQPEPETTGD